MADAQQQLRQAFALMKQGKKREAGQLVQAVLKQDRTNVNAWWLMANLVDDNERKIKSLERLLALQPNHTKAQQMLDSLRPAAPAFAPDALDEFESAPASTPAFPAGALNDAPASAEGNYDDLNLSMPSSRQAMLHKPKVYEVVEEEEPQENYRLVTLAMGALVLFVAGVVVVFGILPALQQTVGPAETVELWLQAFADSDYERMRELTCEAQRGQVDEMERAFSRTAELPEFQIDTSQITTEVVEQSDETATVRVSGELTMSVQGSELPLNLAQLSAYGGAQQNDETPLIKEDGQWRVCGN